MCCSGKKEYEFMKTKNKMDYVDSATATDFVNLLIGQHHEVLAQILEQTEYESPLDILYDAVFFQMHMIAGVMPANE
jgi:hypothetical protein